MKNGPGDGLCFANWGLWKQSCVFSFPSRPPSRSGKPDPAEARAEWTHNYASVGNTKVFGWSLNMWARSWASSCELGLERRGCERREGRGGGGGGAGRGLFSDGADGGNLMRPRLFPDWARARRGGGIALARPSFHAQPATLSGKMRRDVQYQRLGWAGHRNPGESHSGPSGISGERAKEGESVRQRRGPGNVSS